MRHLFAALLLLATPALAEPPVLDELKLLSEHPIEGIARGNLSGLAWCGDALWAVSDREDDRLYRLDASQTVWQAEAELFVAPPVPVTPLPWGLRMRSWAASLVRGGDLDFEGLSCDALGNRYVVSEAHAAVLQIPPAAAAQWLALPSGLVRQARASGMLLHFNALFEGIAVDPAGERLWLAAERQRRGLLVLHKQRSTWRCTGGCVLLSEGGSDFAPPQLDSQLQPRDFSGLAYHNDKLFTLERQAHRICRRQLGNAEVERCWSFAAEALTDARRYAPSYGLAEALWVDTDGAWIGVDSGRMTRADGEARPIVWRFAAPAGGWGSTR
ncbi:esterase-like activity of phytase family protein [Pseudomonas sp. UBA2684]|uniref:esterase-like activity of phytase family protein n=1 Tax=Pseudomonas sp. UBA2684 TaxID=1947311 RepID=UPI000E9E73FA|nr:esterase-like activity of phytase family protein [Pseudomonas sp. UBA2684]HBX56801.1 DNA topoisomerase IV [Pseudomonas sp.]|tara:strand:+ start:2363 stop:3346 length:984 start_codon:yes stop_codon:yes gene_type:complete